MVKLFEGKVALVTGGSTGIGRATALAFAREGAKVVVVNNSNVEKGKETVSLIESADSEAIFIKTDVSNAAEVEAMVNKAVETYGRLDFAFNNAGVGDSMAGIRVNAVCPSFIATPMNKRLLANEPELEKTIKTVLHPIGRLGEPEEVAEAVIWLCSDRASFVTGHPMAVDGGYLAQ